MVARPDLLRSLLVTLYEDKERILEEGKGI